MHFFPINVLCCYTKNIYNLNAVCTSKQIDFLMSFFISLVWLGFLGSLYTAYLKQDTFARETRWWNTSRPYSRNKSINHILICVVSCVFYRLFFEYMCISPDSTGTFIFCYFEPRSKTGEKNPARHKTIPKIKSYIVLFCKQVSCFNEHLIFN